MTTRDSAPPPTTDDADLAISMIDSWMEARDRLNHAAEAALQLPETIPPGGAWQTVLADVRRAVELIAQFDDSGPELFEAVHTDRRRLMLDIGGSLRDEVVMRLLEVDQVVHAAVALWGFPLGEL